MPTPVQITTADISFNDNGTPVSSTFDDVYFSNNNGLKETHYVFVENNRLLERWDACESGHFIIAETGFGTGLNFLVTLKLFNEFRQQHPSHPLKQLYFTSFEKFPIGLNDLTQALKAWPELAQEAQQLIAQYPLPISGCHRLNFNVEQTQGVFLDLWLGDVNETLPLLPTHLHGSVNAWFLDGFAPSKNPDMWQDTLFEYVALLTAPNGTFATFTAAGLVRRSLQRVGFDIEKKKGFGKKREMLRGVKPATSSNVETSFESSSTGHPPPETKLRLREHAGPRYWQRTRLSTPKSTSEANTNQPAHIGIVGGGLAGLNCAYSLLQHGHRVTLFERAETLAHGASGNKQGGFYPHLTVDVNITSQLYALSFLYAKRRYQSLHAQGFAFEHDNCGVLLLGFNEKQRERQQTLIEQQHWPESLIHGVSQREAQQIANLSLECGGLFMPGAGWINPGSLVQALASACQQYDTFKIHLSSPVTAFEKCDQGWHLSLPEDKQIHTDVVILATGHVSAKTAPLQGLPFQSVRGQVEIVPSQGELANLSTVLCHKGYLTPALSGTHALGATFVKNDDTVDYRKEEEAANLATLTKTMANTAWTHDIKTHQTGRASIRCTTPDHLPLFGNVPNLPKQKEQYKDLYKALAHHKYPYPEIEDNMYLLTGLGSRGLCTSPLLSEALACQISGKPLPLSQPLLNALSPNRFLIKRLIRRLVD